jgi:hypothetical protein
VWPRTFKRHGRELGNAAAAAEVRGVSWETFTWYARRDRKRREEARAKGQPVDERYLCPWRVDRDDETGQSLYPMKEVRTWTRNSRGRGTWSGIGRDLRTREARLERAAGIDDRARVARAAATGPEPEPPAATDEPPVAVGA